MHLRDFFRSFAFHVSDVTCKEETEIVLGLFADCAIIEKSPHVDEIRESVIIKTYKYLWPGPVRARKKTARK